MEAKGIYLILGWLLACIAATLGGFALHGVVGTLLVVAGIGGLIVWVILIFDIGSALNSDH